MTFFAAIIVDEHKSIKHILLTSCSNSTTFPARLTKMIGLTQLAAESPSTAIPMHNAHNSNA